MGNAGLRTPVLLTAAVALVEVELVSAGAVAFLQNTTNHHQYHVRACTCVQARTCVCMHACESLCVCVCVCAHAHVSLCVCVCVCHARMCLCVHVCVHTRAREQTGENPGFL